MQVTLQLLALPISRLVVHGSPSSQLVGHGVALFASQVSPLLDSMVPLPHVDEQSLSRFLLHMAGQQWSPLTHVVISVTSQRTSHVSGEPVIFGARQALLELQVGQLLGGSQVSCASSTPLPHTT